MNLNIILGAVLFALGAIQLLPVIRRRAAERGLLGGIVIPLILAVISFVVFMVGVLIGLKRLFFNHSLGHILGHHEFMIKIII